MKRFDQIVELIFIKETKYRNKRRIFYCERNLNGVKLSTLSISCQTDVIKLHVLKIIYVMRKKKLLDYFCWELRAKASCFSLEIPNLSATFSEVMLQKTNIHTVIDHVFKLHFSRIIWQIWGIWVVFLTNNLKHIISAVWSSSLTPSGWYSLWPCRCPSAWSSDLPGFQSDATTCSPLWHEHKQCFMCTSSNIYS